MEAEKSLVKAEVVLNQYIKSSGGGGGDPSLEMRIAWAMGTLCTKQKKYDLAKMFLKKVSTVYHACWFVAFCIHCIFAP